MAVQFGIQGPSTVCAATGRTLNVGDRFYGALLEEAGKFVRKDFAADAWNGPPEGAIAFWQGRIPTSDKPKKPKFNEALLVDCFDHLTGSTDKNRQNFRYVVALMLMRQKRLKFEDTRREADGSHTLIVRDARNGARVEVLDPKLTDDEITAIQDEVFRVMGWE